VGQTSRRAGKKTREKSTPRPAEGDISRRFLRLKGLRFRISGCQKSRRGRTGTEAEGNRGPKGRSRKGLSVYLPKRDLSFTLGHRPTGVRAEERGRDQAIGAAQEKIIPHAVEEPTKKHRTGRLRWGRETKGDRIGGDKGSSLKVKEIGGFSFAGSGTVF